MKSTLNIGPLGVLAAWLLMPLGGPAFVAAAIITVNSNAQLDTSPGVCTLTSAINAANSNAAVAGCAAGSGADIIVLPQALSPYQLATVDHTTNTDGVIGGTGLPVITTTITIRGDTEDTPSVIERAGAPTPPAFRILHVAATGNLTLENLVIAGGEASDGDCEPFVDPPGCASGGGILNRGGTLALDNTTVRDNSAALDGGGISSVVVQLASDPEAVYATPVTTLTDSSVRDNHGFSFGGGIHNEGTLTLTRTTVKDNTHVHDGAGIANTPSFLNFAPATAMLEDSTVDHNTSLGEDTAFGPIGGVGAGIFNGDGAALTAVRSTISRNINVMYVGGGLFNNDDGTATFVNSTISGNSAVSGAGIYNAVNAFLNISHTTITDNTASDSGGGILNDGQPEIPPPFDGFPPIPAAVGTVKLKNSILAANTATTGPDCFTTSDPVSEITSFGYNLVGNVADCTFTSATGDQVGGGADPVIDPKLDALAFNLGPTETHALMADSPALDAVPVSNCKDLNGTTVDTDQQGLTRPQGTACDTGAFEFLAAVPTPLDDFMCYKTKNSKGFKFTPPPAVSLSNLFESGQFDLKKPVGLCAPASRTVDPAHDPDTHMAGFQITLVKGQPKPGKHTNLTVNNVVEFADLTVDTNKPDRLLVPASKCIGVGCPSPAPDFLAHEVDHYECYSVKITKGTPKFPKGLTVTATDQFTGGAVQFNVKKATHLCVATEKNLEAAKNPDAHLMCYQVKRAKGQGKHTPVSTVLNDQFGIQFQDTVTEDEICLPSTLGPGA